MIDNESASQSQLSTDLEMLHARVKGKSLTFAELKQALKDRGSAMLLVLLALPFCFIPIPGLFHTFWYCHMFDRRMSSDRTRAMAARFIMRRRLSPTCLTQLLTGAVKMARQLEKFVRLRFAFLHAGPGMLRLIGLGIVIAGLGLMLPCPFRFRITFSIRRSEATHRCHHGI
jgi:hypothetical protein